MTVYASYDVLEIQPSREGEKPHSYSRPFSLFDTKTGQRSSSPNGPMPAVTHPFIWVAQGRPACQQVIDFLLARKGRAVPFWVPTYQRDLRPSEDILTDGEDITIKRVSYTSQMFVAGGARRHLAVFPHPGAAPLYRKVLNSEESISGTETLTVDSSFPGTYPKDTVMISFLVLCRLTEDMNSYEWLTNEVIRAELSFTEIPLEAPT